MPANPAPAGHRRLACGAAAMIAAQHFGSISGGKVMLAMALSCAVAGLKGEAR